MNQVATLFAARRRAYRNARSLGVGAFHVWSLGAMAIVSGALLGVGEVATSSLLAVPHAMATPVFGGRAPVVGDNAIEAAFWLSCLLSMFFSFRTMESMFRSTHVRAVELLPVTPAALFAERTANTAGEAVLLGAVASLFFAPLAWHGAAHVAGLAAVLLVVAMLVTGAATLGINAWFGAQWGGSSSMGDAYGSQGGAFIYAPMLALTAAVGANFMLQLGAREVLHDGRLTNAALLAAGIGVAVGVGALVVGARHFVQSYHRVAAFFREADEVGFQALLDYQQSAWRPVRFEQYAGAGAIVFRRHTLQFSRRFAVGRSLALLGSIGAGAAAFAFAAEVYPGWLAALLPAVFLGAIARVYTRIDDPRLGGVADDLLSLTRSARHRATVVWWLAETVRVAMPFAVVYATARIATGAPAEALPAVLGMLVATACTAVVSLVAARTTSTITRGVALVLMILALGVVAAANILIALGVAAAVTVILTPLALAEVP